MARSDPYSLRLKLQKSAGDADQTEFAAVRLGTTIVGSGSYDDRVASALDDFASDLQDTADWANEDLTADTAVGSIQEEIERRSTLLGAAYPFSLTKGTLTYTPSTHRAYEFFLAAAVSNSLTKGPFANLPRVFERLSTELVALWVGGSAAVHTGYPRDPAVGTKFADAMAHVCEKFREPQWSPQHHVPAAPGFGDHGVDFIVCKASPDKRPIGQLFVLAQCACGNDWTSKFGDLTLDRIEKWFHPFSHVPAVRAFATPHHVVDGWLYDASDRAGLVFDRARLTCIANRPDAASIGAKFLTDIHKLIEAVLTQKS